MNRILCLSIFAVFCASPALADSFWTPSPEAVQKADDGIGAIVNFPGSACPARPKARFSRHYFGSTDEAGRRFLRAQFMLASTGTDQGAGIHIETSWYPIADGGCGVANVWFDADTSSVVQASWGEQ